MNGASAASQFGHDTKRQLNGAAIVEHFQPNVNSVMNRVLGVNSGLEEEAGAQFGLVFVRPVMMKD